MYTIGDKIVYPLYGAGTIQDLENKDINGVTSTYYVLDIPIGNLTIHVSAAKADDMGVRLVTEKTLIAAQIATAITAKVNPSLNWNLRYKENMNRIKSGDLPQVAIVYNSLLLRERDKGLSTAEKKMMISAKQIILSEIILSLDIEKEAAETTLGEIFNPPIHLERTSPS